MSQVEKLRKIEGEPANAPRPQGPDAAAAPPAAPAAQPAPPKSGRRRILLLAGPLVAVVVGLYLFLSGGRYVSTDNAYVQAGILSVTPQIAGTVTEVPVADNSEVRKGDVLFHLDPEPYRIAVDGARAQLMMTRDQLHALAQTYRQNLATIRQAQADLALAKTEYDRVANLMSRQVASQNQLDSARHNLDVGGAKLSALQAQAAAVLAQLGGDADRPAEAQAQYLQAKAQLDKAERDLRLTAVVSPIDGIVTKVSNLQPGTVLAAGTPAFSVVSSKDTWVDANLKETDLAYLKVGDPVALTVDAYPGLKLTGRVDTLSPATGSQFAVLPAQNATGNWVKVVQRVPVRIQIENAGSGRVLRAGMSANVDIDTGHRRHLKDLAGDIAAIF